MSAIVRLPDRVQAAIWLTHEPFGAWLVLARGHGWIFGSSTAASTDAEWLSENLGLPIREKLTRRSSEPIEIGGGR
jgi:hypothetical protein